MKKVDVKIVPMAAAELDGYCEKIAIAENRPADGARNGWTSWYPVLSLGPDECRHVGFVRSAAGSQVAEMEMHPHRAEVVFAIDRPVVQVVARSTAAGDGPDIDTVRAFFVAPGEGVRVLPGIWHGVGLPYRQESVDYWFFLTQPAARDVREELGWKGFRDGAVVNLIM